MRFFGKVFILILSCMPLLAHADCILPNEVTNAFKNGSPTLRFRLRQEDSRQQGLKNGYATTLRTKVGFETTEFYNSIFKVELVDVAHFFGMHYNPGVSDLYLPQYTLIADPPGAGITEIKLTYNGFNANEIILGRQYIVLDNQRFVGPNDFRQYPQSFDAIAIRNNYIPNIEIFYAYVMAVNTNYANGRASNGQQTLSTNLINVDWDSNQFRVGSYVYLNNDHTINTNSNMTLGARLLSPENLEETDNYAYLFEVAWQKSQFNNPNSYTATYMHFYLSKTVDYFSAIAGYERLSGNKYALNKAFITPLGSVDNFNGMAQVFTTTPNRGLQDTYFTLTAHKYDALLGLTYHVFFLDKGKNKLAGHEIDIYLQWHINTQIDFNIAYSNYSAKNYPPSTYRFWVMLSAYLL